MLIIPVPFSLWLLIPFVFLPNAHFILRISVVLNVIQVSPKLAKITVRSITAQEFTSPAKCMTECFCSYWPDSRRFSPEFLALELHSTQPKYAFKN